MLSDSLDQAGQTHYRIVVTAGQTTVYDSGWLAGTASTHQIPAVVHLGITYTVVVSVRDTSGFEGSSDPTRFTSLWPAPTDPLDVIADISAVDDPVRRRRAGDLERHPGRSLLPEWGAYRRHHRARPPGSAIGTSGAKTGRGEILDYLFESGRTYEYGLSQVAYRYFNETSESAHQERDGHARERQVLVDPRHRSRPSTWR